jgi:hypothetical protein
MPMPTRSNSQPGFRKRLLEDLLRAWAMLLIYIVSGADTPRSFSPLAMT